MADKLLNASPTRAGSVLILEGDPSRAFRSMARTVLGHLREGQIGDRGLQIQLLEQLGSVELEAIAERPDRPAGLAEEILREAYQRQPPSTLVAFDPTAALVASRWAASLSHLERPPFTVGVVGSLWLDPLWLKPPLERFILPDEGLASQLAAHGRPSEALVPIGLGVCGRFGAGVAEGRRSCRLSLGLPLDLPALLLVTEGFFTDEVLRYVEAASRCQSSGQPCFLMVDAAGDRLALGAARDLLERHGLPWRVFGHVDEAGLLWGAADRVAGRALDQLVTRALTCRAPYFALAPADARQRGLVSALERLGAGEAIRDAEALASRLLSPIPWDQPLDASRMETVASPSVLPRIAEALTQMVVEHEAKV
ncbi:MAG: hypothetical protein RBU30_23225 [Polyangia bacterium]|jgi:hypothetical protein|nr:hypothetical protein [Polyangia bacterium]